MASAGATSDLGYVSALARQHVQAYSCVSTPCALGVQLLALCAQAVLHPSALGGDVAPVQAVLHALSELSAGNSELQAPLASAMAAALQRPTPEGEMLRLQQVQPASGWLAGLSAVAGRVSCLLDGSSGAGAGAGAGVAINIGAPHANGHQQQQQPPIGSPALGNGSISPTTLGGGKTPLASFFEQRAAGGPSALDAVAGLLGVDNTPRVSEAASHHSHGSTASERTPGMDMLHGGQGDAGGTGE
jgi:hypothetical protein